MKSIILLFSFFFISQMNVCSCVLFSFAFRTFLFRHWVIDRSKKKTQKYRLTRDLSIYKIIFKYCINPRKENFGCWLCVHSACISFSFLPSHQAFCRAMLLSRCVSLFSTRQNVYTEMCRIIIIVFANQHIIHSNFGTHFRFEVSIQWQIFIHHCPTFSVHTHTLFFFKHIILLFVLKMGLCGTRASGCNWMLSISM